MRRTTYSSYSSSGPTAWLKWMSLIVVFGGFGFLVWYASANKDALQSESIQPSLIEPAAGPVKVRAQNPGGMDVPNRDKRVFDLLEDPSVQKADAADSVDMVCEAQGGNIVCNEASPKVTEIKRMPAPEMPKAQEQLDLAREDIGNIIEKLEETPKEDIQVASLKPVQAVVQPKPEPKKVEKVVQEKVKKVVAQPAVASGLWGVQLASFRSMAEAEKNAANMKNKHTVLKTMTQRVQRAVVKGATYYRVQFFTDKGKGSAKSVCKALKSAGQGCFNVKS